MNIQSQNRHKIILNLAKLNELNAEGCAACGRKFELGETVVMACGTWDGGPKFIHENEAVFDAQAGGFIERSCVPGPIG